MKSGANRGGLVYSTDSGRMCPECRRPLADCVCRVARPASAGDGVAKVMREKKGRAGKTVTVVRNLVLDPVELTALARELKNACGSGGTLRDGVLEIQGDHVDRVLQALEARGLKAKRAGG
ncbi:MAG: translation initiation factor Sui1 [Rhodoferax sp.]|jgi:translation initiation factor 1|nr:translation initiation factor Sui1 [Rhodoferax sp.]